MRTLSILAALPLFGCAVSYTPTEYPLRDGVIPAMPVSGQVQVTNAQQDTKPVVVYSYMGSSMSSDLRSITEVMVQQTTKEVAKASRPKSGNPKTIALKVDSLLSTYAGFHWNSNLNFSATLGNGQVVAMTVPHTSGSVHQDLNGCIADSVVKLLNDGRVRDYLAR